MEQSGTQGSQVGHSPVPVGLGKPEILGPSPVLAFFLAMLVSLAVFGLLWKIRKSFGMKS